MTTFLLLENFEQVIWIHINSTASIADATVKVKASHSIANMVFL